MGQGYRFSKETTEEGVQIAVVPARGVNSKADSVYDGLFSVERMSVDTYEDLDLAVADNTRGCGYVMYHVWNSRMNSFDHMQNLPPKDILDDRLFGGSTQNDTVVDCPDGTTSGETADRPCGDAAEESAFDNVNHPKRYTRGKVECIDAQESAMCGKPADEAHCVAEVIGYLWRYDLKEPLRSIESAEWYLKRLKDKVQSRMSSNK